MTLARQAVTPSFIAGLQGVLPQRNSHLACHCGNAVSAGLAQNLQSAEFSLLVDWVGAMLIVIVVCVPKCQGGLRECVHGRSCCLSLHHLTLPPPLAVCSMAPGQHIAMWPRKPEEADPGPLQGPPQEHQRVR